MVINSSFEVRFPAIRGIQAGREYYVAMCPLETVVRLVKLEPEDETVPAQMRAQRFVNRARVPAIARYIVENINSYVFSSLTVSVDKCVKFESSENGDDLTRLGLLTVPLDATFLINDGQHRRAAIEVALHEKPELKYETISMVIFVDQGLKRSQQLFADLNRYVVRPTPSLSILYDYRDPMSLLAQHVADTVTVFRGMTEKARATISNRSAKLFTLSSIFHSNCQLLGRTRTKRVTDSERDLVVRFWDDVGRNMQDWQLALERKVLPSDLRRDYVHAHGIALRALARAGVDILCQPPNTWRKTLSRLKDVDWARANEKVWDGRALIAGKISKAHNNIILTGNEIKKAIGLPLNPVEESIEKKFLKARSN